ERVSMPDFDIDFCMDGRDRVIDYVARDYGRDKVSQIITYGSMAAKAVVRDVGRVMNHPYGFVDQIAKLIPFEVGITLEQAMEQEDDLRDLYERDEEVAALLDMARRLEGLTRNAGKHAGGVVISPTALTDFTPLYCDEGGGNVVSQFDKNDVEAVGLVKFDFLGLRTLTIIDWALKHIENSFGKKVDIATIPLDDPATFRLLMDSQTTAVFQLESRGMKELISRLLPNCFEDIIALVALFRPGPLQSGMVDDFINRKHGRAKVEYPHPDLEPILQPTYGVILYQEQVMQIAQVLAGYTLGGADMLRRAMGKKKPEEMAKQRDIFTKGALENGVEEKTATYIFDLMEKFAGYGFNKSHSAAYALVSYQTAWLKAHYPSAFMAAVLSADMDNTDKVVMLIDECSSMKLKVLSPSINHSEYKFTVLPSGEVVYGLGAIKGVGEGAIEGIVEERKKELFTDLYQFCRRVDLRKTNKRVLDSLIRAGALDSLKATRASMMAVLPNAIQLADQDAKNQAAGIDDLFGFEGESLQQSATEIPELPEWDDDTRLGGEKETLGLYLTGHPIDRYLDELGQFISTRISGIKPEKGRNIIISGLIIAIRTMNTKRGDKIAFITLDDKSARVEIALFTEAYAQFGDMLARDRLVVVEGEASVDDYSGMNRMQANFVTDIDGARERYAKKLQLVLSHESGAEQLAKLRSTIEPYCEGITPIQIEYLNRGAKAQLLLGDDWHIRPAEQLMQRLCHTFGEENVRLDYGKS
ncbi:MAG: DNA polymerase III subunit alpha, partial [Gammaproteobacteria bacterium]|nr:DNA polymerase III subunit alpha [Gammaproteobacteria bacterium]